MKKSLTLKLQHTTEDCSDAFILPAHPAVSFCSTLFRKVFPDAENKTSVNLTITLKKQRRKGEVAIKYTPYGQTPLPWIELADGTDMQILLDAGRFVVKALDIKPQQIFFARVH